MWTSNHRSILLVSSQCSNSKVSKLKKYQVKLKVLWEHPHQDLESKWVPTWYISSITASSLASIIHTWSRQSGHARILVMLEIPMKCISSHNSGMSRGVFHQWGHSHRTISFALHFCYLSNIAKGTMCPGVIQCFEGCCQKKTSVRVQTASTLSRTIVTKMAHQQYLYTCQLRKKLHIRYSILTFELILFLKLTRNKIILL